MKMDIGEVFCELLSGLAIIFLVLPFLDLWKISSLSQSLGFIGRHNAAAELAGALVFAYSLGLIMDAVGIAVGESYLYPRLYKRINEKEPSAQDRKRFYENSSSHVLQHREYEYAYLLVYTNLIIIAVFAGVLWSVWALIRCGWRWSSFVAFVFVFLGWAFWKSIEFHLEQDAEITRAYAGADSNQLPRD